MFAVFVHSANGSQANESQIPKFFQTRSAARSGAKMLIREGAGAVSIYTAPNIGDPVKAKAALELGWGTLLETRQAQRRD